MAWHQSGRQHAIRDITFHYTLTPQQPPSHKLQQETHREINKSYTQRYFCLILALTMPSVSILHKLWITFAPLRMRQRYMGSWHWWQGSTTESALRSEMTRTRR